MKPLLIAICDDRKAEYDKLLPLINDAGISCKHDYFKDGRSFLDDFYPGKYDLILMDIFMDDIDGISAVTELRKKDRNVPVAFLTTSKEHALDGYRLHVDRYLVKPLNKEDLLELLNHALHVRDTEESISIVSKGDILLIPLARIVYVEQHGHSLSIHMTDGSEETLSMKLSEFLTKLPQPPFVQCHKSFIVNLDQVAFLNTDLLVFEMNEGSNVYIRRGSLKTVKDAYHDYMFERTRKDMSK